MTLYSTQEGEETVEVIRQVVLEGPILPLVMRMSVVMTLAAVQKIGQVTLLL